MPKILDIYINYLYDLIDKDANVRDFLIHHDTINMPSKNFEKIINTLNVQLIRAKNMGDVST